MDGTTGIIRSFRGEYRWLSNFWLSTIVDKTGVKWPSAEHAYQGAKFANDDPHRELIRLAATPAEAKRLGRQGNLRSNWTEICVSVMRRIVAAKFEQNSELAARLISTGNLVLVEGNYWHDNFWGVCSCHTCPVLDAKNHLGRILMEVRSQLQEASVG